MKTTKKLNSGALHIACNFNLFGFGSVNSALVQCVKELVENSIDACKSLPPGVDSPSISVSLIKEGTEDSLVVTVTDNGVGMNDITKLLQCFETTKVNDGIHSTGRFGVGLSTCLIYSLLNCNHAVRVTSKTRNDELCSVSDFVLDQSGNPSAIQSTDQSVTMVSGTRISLRMPLPDESGLMHGLDAIIVFLNLYSLLPTTFININLMVDIQGVNGDRLLQELQFGSYCNETASRYHVTSSLEYKSNLLTRYLSMITAGDSSVSEISAVCVPLQGVGDNGQSSSAVVSVIVMNTASPANCMNPTDPPACSNMPLTLHRYVNGVPLPDWQDDAPSCAISAALRGVRWHLFGLSLSLALQRVQAPNQQTQRSAILRAPLWTLNSTCGLVDLDQFSVAVICDIQAKHVPFANMRKTCISSDEKLLVTAVSKGITICVRELQSKDLTKQIFMNRRDSEQQRIVSIYIPSVVSSVVKILYLSQDKSYVRSLLDKLMIDKSDDMQERAELHSKLQLLLQNHDVSKKKQRKCTEL